MAGCMKTGLGLMLHEDRGEFILMGKQPLKPSSHDFFISRREQEVSQLTGVNAANCAADKKWDAKKRGGEEEEKRQGNSPPPPSKSRCVQDVYVRRCVCSLHPAPSYSCGGFHGGNCVNTRMHVKYDDS